jgi:hypothetical protein
MYIHAVVSVVGYHHWPDAPPEVGYLKQQHRHVFTFKVSARVQHHDRDLEFHTMQRIIRGLIPALGERVAADEVNFGAASCEMLATKLSKALREHIHPVYPNAIEVWEDNENGATVLFSE